MIFFTCNETSILFFIKQGTNTSNNFLETNTASHRNTIQSNSGVSLFSGVLMSWGVVVRRVREGRTRGKFSKTGHSGAFFANCEGLRWTLISPLCSSERA